jgi:hypothetical protein
MMGGMLMLLLSGCASSPEEVVIEKKPVLKIYVFAPDRPVVTRGDIGDVDASEAENAVNSLHVWVFDHSDGSLVGHISLSDPSMNDQLDEGDPSIVGKLVTMGVSDEFATKMASETKPTVDVYVMANVTPYNCGLSLDAGSTRDDLEAACIEHKATGGDFFGVTALTDAVMPVPESGLPMSGVLKAMPVGGESPVFKVKASNEENAGMAIVQLVRAVSKIRFVFTKSITLADQTTVSIKSITLNEGVLPKQENLFLSGPYNTPEGTNVCGVKNGIEYNDAATLVSNVPYDKINACDNPSDYLYTGNENEGTELSKGQAYEEKINDGLTVKDGQTNADLSEVGRFYLRESDKVIKGTITYSMESLDENKTATFEMKGAGDFTRNHTWIVYGYFVGTSGLVLNVVNVKAWGEKVGSHEFYNW